ncbi:MAG: hypothetical protein OXC27_13210, partial [Caldilineaceae bacterium]|nr:hypothetical protein [Caldilineaceae bacterium]
AAIGRVNAEAAAPTFLTAHGQQGSTHPLPLPLFIRHKHCTVFKCDAGTAQMSEHGIRFHVHIVPVIGETSVEALAKGFDFNCGAGYDGRLLRLRQVGRASSGGQWSIKG